MRTSALHSIHQEHSAAIAGWRETGGMVLPARYQQEADAAVLGLGDASWLRRSGIKGPAAARHLESLGYPTPAQANRWLALPGPGGLIARLGLTEYLLEDDGHACQALEASTPPGGAYPVMRSDTALVLSGSVAPEVLLQTCSIDFSTISPERGELVLTAMTGVPVLVIPLLAGPVHLYRIWCDPSYGPYLYRTLLSIVEELGGGPIGVDQLAPLLAASTQSAAHSTTTSINSGQPGRVHIPGEA